MKTCWCDYPPGPGGVHEGACCEIARLVDEVRGLRATLVAIQTAEFQEQTRLIDERNMARADLEAAARRHDADVTQLKRQRDEALGEVRGLRSCLAKIALALNSFESRDVGNKRIFEAAGYPEEWLEELEADDKSQSIDREHPS